MLICGPSDMLLAFTVHMTATHSPSPSSILFASALVSTLILYSPNTC
ncbi:hypothetical protein LEMLEM_LOCUS21545, partial [Lemmus lemmus]